jgi:hypothetical protein
MKKSLFSAIAVGLCMTAHVMAQVPSYVPTNGLVGYWPFNENANDESGNGNNGTVNGATLTTDRFGNSNKAYSFDGVDDYVQIANNISLEPNSSISISAWVFLDPSQTTNFPPIISKEGGMSWGYTSYALIGGNAGLNQLGDIGLQVTTNNGGYQWTGVTGASFLNQWVFVTGIYDGSNMKIYHNGSLTSTTPKTGNIQYENYLLTIARSMANSTSIFSFFKGNIDDIGIWNRALTPQEISDLYYAFNCANNLTVSPSINSLQTGSTANFIATTSDANASFVWQSDFGQGFVTLNNYGSYSGANSNSLSISNIQLSNHNQPIRAISSNTNCTDTSNVATIQIADTCITTVYDTLLTTVTDTLVINTTLSLPAPNNENTILIYPNPASDHITIDNGNYTSMAGYTIKIENNAGQQVFQSAINQAQFYVDLSSWTGNGLYFVHLIDPQNNTVTVKKIVLQ